MPWLQIIYFKILKFHFWSQIYGSKFIILRPMNVDFIIIMIMKLMNGYVLSFY